MLGLLSLRHQVAGEMKKLGKKGKEFNF